jgi:SAM-dependent methyltransferase
MQSYFFTIPKTLTLPKLFFMKISYLISLLTFVFLTLNLSCDDNIPENGNLNKRPELKPATPDEYDTSNETRIKTAPDSEHIDANIEIRGIWQKPNVVIKKLGELEGKVVADIGAGPYGYFTLRIAHQTPAKKIIALDIDPNAIKFIEGAKILLAENIRNRIETRLVLPNDPKLKTEEADVVLIVNTYTYIEDNMNYLKNLKNGIAKGGKIVIIDFKKRHTPVGPPIRKRAALGEVEHDLIGAGYKKIDSDDKTLEYQYIVTAYVD